jgi:hypothetical protein
LIFLIINQFVKVVGNGNQFAGPAFFLADFHCLYGVFGFQLFNSIDNSVQK